MKSKHLLTCLLPLVALLAAAPGARADELVQVAPHRIAMTDQSTDTPPLFGFLARPDGPGPFAAVVLLSGCFGISQHEVAAAETLKSWGYAALALDLLGGGNACSDPASGARAAERNAYTALHYLATQPFVDPGKVAVVGYSMGAWAALTDVEQGSLQGGQAEHFRSAVLYYPWCGSSNGVMTVPVLILIGDADDWCPASLCKEMVAHQSDASVQRPSEGGVPVKLVVYPEAAHDFDFPGLDTKHLGHVVKTDEPAAKDAEVQMHAFLRETLGGPASSN